jgi:hypothetical protein
MDMSRIVAFAQRKVGHAAKYFRKKSSAEPMPIIVGAPRSGTTLLRFMLDSHSRIAIPPETGFLCESSIIQRSDRISCHEFYKIVTNYPPEMPCWRDFQIPKKIFWDALSQIQSFTIAEGFRTFYRVYASHFNKSRWGDKTPTYCFHLRDIETVLPEAHFIHIIRDGRDVALSLRQTWFSPGNDIHILATYWNDCVVSAQKQGSDCRHYLEVRYEDLVRNTRWVLKKICAFLSLPYDRAMERYHERTPLRLREHQSRLSSDGTLVVSHQQRLKQQYMTQFPPDASRIFIWKEMMSLGEQQIFASIAGELLNNLGYEISGHACESFLCPPSSIHKEDDLY